MNSTHVNANTITRSVLSALPSSARLHISRPGRSFSPIIDGRSTRFLIPSAQPSAYISSSRVFDNLPWLSAERISVKSGASMVGYVLTEDDTWMIVLKDAPRTIQYVPVDDVVSRTVCQVGSQESNIPGSPLFPLLNPKSAQLPSCSRSRSNSSGPTVNQQSSEWTAREVTTANGRFSSVPNLGRLEVCASGEVSVTISVELNGAPAGFRVLIDRRQVMEPGAVRFVPAGARDSFSFTFVQNLNSLAGLDLHALQVQWRAPCRIATSMERATVYVQYRHPSDNC